MSPRESLYPGDWRKVAREDWRRIHVMLASEDAVGAGFFLQQALEKFLKGYLLGKNWRLKKIHDLEVLLEDVCEFDESLRQFAGLCEQATGLYLTERYPSLGDSDLERADIKRRPDK